MMVEHEKLLAIRFAETQSEWRRLEDGEALDAYLAEAGCPGTTAVHLHEDSRGFTLADGLIAETGSVIQSARLPGARRCAYLADSHFVLLPEEAICETLGDFLRAAGPAWRRRCGHSLTLITGPSRTADIEKVLVLGAHGPRRLVVGTAPLALLRERFDDEILGQGVKP
jgi:hypothetical protein